MDYLSILVRSAFSFIYLLILSKMTGKRQISQMTFYDYTTAVTIGSIAAVMAVETVEVMAAVVQDRVIHNRAGQCEKCGNSERGFYVPFT